MNLLDYYELRARFIPTLIVGMPIIFTFNFILENQHVKTISLVGSSIVSLIIFIYPFSFVVRYCGRKLESSLWSKWDGPPSTKFLRWRDSFFESAYKRQLHECILKVLNIDLLSCVEEENDPTLADSKINQAFTQAKSILRQYDPEGLSYKHNAEYGFNRNLFGNRIIWLFMSLGGIGICASLLYFTKMEINLYFFLNIFWLLIAMLAGWVILPRTVEESAKRYAESSWADFLTISKSKFQ